MWKVVSNIIEIFVYSAVYVIIVMVSLKIIGSTFSTDFEKKIVNEGNVGLALIGASLFIGLAILLASIIS
ncbi:MAG TPA: hypothetical protein DDW17_06105 [Deltaproteobacteria bacterium]|jgi:uncharacterized membrane protein YjfL (UPF0719 family)|nr:hypothetical protein [Deltaproteobacteria bacterium]